MNPYRLLLAVAICVSGLSSVRADDAPFSMGAQYSADQVVTTARGTMTNKVYVDNGKIRTEMNANGMQIVSIVRPDQNKVYSVMVTSKMVMVMPYDPSKVSGQPTTAGSKFETVGPDTADGVACIKYKATASDGKVSFYWADASTKLPVKMASEDGAYTIEWKNYQTGPQDAALFEPPAGFQVMNMPGAPPPAGQ
jgi:hypothetical protein